MFQASGISDLTDISLAEYMSDADALKHVREQFYYPKCGTLPDGDTKINANTSKVSVDTLLCDPEADSIYLCGNSLGLMPRATERIMKEQLDKWARM